MKRPVQVLIPFKLNDAKSRLGSFLSPEERRLFALAMLRDVIRSASCAGRITIIAKPGFDKSYWCDNFRVIICNLNLNDAINEFIERRQIEGWLEDVLIVMADLALLTPADVEGMLETEGDVVFSPGRGGGTNMILIRNPLFRAQYRGLSFLKHMDFAMNLGIDARVYSSYYAACDIDEPSDLAEVLIHGRADSRSFLESIGIELTERGRATIARKAPSHNVSDKDINIKRTQQY